MNEIELGHDHWLRWVAWAPDRELNPQYAHLPDMPRYAAIVRHTKPDGDQCEGMITFDSPVARELERGEMWNVASWDPLTLSPSLLCHCGDHGFIVDGRWVPA